MKLGRRGFLQRLSWVLTALGTADLVAPVSWRPYAHALAQPSRRKLALLIGIDKYPEQVVGAVPAQDVLLKGAVTDLELQRELLIHRFGFVPADILLLSDQKATRQGILDAIEDHLINQVRSGDIVLLHFSGYGSTLQLTQQKGKTFRSLVPVDGTLPSEEHPRLQDLLEIDLKRQLSRIKTSKITTVLDAGFRDLGQVRWGTLRVRSRPVAPTGEAPEDFNAAVSDAKEWPGLLLRAASPDRLALEGAWSGFNAGVFTYALTRTLWQVLPATSTNVVLRQTDQLLQQTTGPDQRPDLSGSRSGDEPPYGLSPSPPQADGVVTSTRVSDKTTRLWLGGVSALVLEHLQTNSRFQVIGGGSEVTAVAGEKEQSQVGELRLQERSGLTATGVLSTDTMTMPGVGQTLTEWVRVFPRDIYLVVALDTNLERIERVDATSALSGIPFLTSTLAGEQPADCLFGRLPDLPTTTLAAAPPSMAAASDIRPLLGLKEDDRPERYGLFAPNRTLIPETLVSKEEAVKTAVSRLTPHLQTLLAMKLMRLTENAAASRIPAQATLEVTRPDTVILLQRSTVRSAEHLREKLERHDMGTSIPFQVSADNRIHYRIRNHGKQPIYLSVLSFDSRGQFLALVPDLPKNQSEDEHQALMMQGAAVNAGETRIVPSEPMDWGVPSAATWVETFLVLSTVPLYRTWKVLRQAEGETVRQPGLRRLNQPLQAARALMADLHQAAVALDNSLASTESYALHVNTWATFSFRYPVGMS